MKSYLARPRDEMTLELEAAEARDAAARMGDDEPTPRPPTSGAIRFPEVLTLPDFALIAGIEAADRRDPSLRVDDFDKYLDEASAELVRRLDAPDDKAIAAIVQKCGHNSVEHCEAIAATLGMKELTATLRNPEPSHFSKHVVAVYSNEVVRRLDPSAALATDVQMSTPELWDDVVDHDGESIFEFIPAPGAKVARTFALTVDGTKYATLAQARYAARLAA